MKKLILVVLASVVLAGCVYRPYPYYGDRYRGGYADRYYGGSYRNNGYYDRDYRSDRYDRGYYDRDYDR